MRFTTIILFVAIIVLCREVDGAKKKKGGKKDACHLRDIEACISKVQELGKRKDPSALIASNEGLNTICKTTRDDLTKCIKSYMKKCGTPLHREVTDLLTDQITNQVARFCDPKNPARGSEWSNFFPVIYFYLKTIFFLFTAFLKHSPCMHKKVFSQNEYKTTCNNNFLATVDAVDTQSVDGDKTHTMICCGFNRWDACTKKIVTKECGNEASNSYDGFIGESFGTIARMVCPVNLYNTKVSQCKAVLPKEGTIGKGQLGDNALTKYVTSLFSFLFVLPK